MKGLRELFESIVFAGMKPGARPGQTQERKWLGPLRGLVERLLSGSAPSDPLYLTNRSRGHRIKAWSLVAIPCLFIVGLVALALGNGYFDPPAAAPPKESSAEEAATIAAKIAEARFELDAARGVDPTDVPLNGDRPSIE